MMIITDSMRETILGHFEVFRDAVYEEDTPEELETIIEKAQQSDNADVAGSAWYVTGWANALELAPEELISECLQDRGKCPKCKTGDLHQGISCERDCLHCGSCEYGTFDPDEGGDNGEKEKRTDV